MNVCKINKIEEIFWGCSISRRQTRKMCGVIHCYSQPVGFASSTWAKEDKYRQ